MFRVKKMLKFLRKTSCFGIDKSAPPKRQRRRWLGRVSKLPTNFEARDAVRKGKIKREKTAKRDETKRER